ncbi:hypothetical protein ACFLV4_03715 [Chloroflexota bacterium]
MDCARWLQVAGLFLAFIGAIFLSIDILGKKQVYHFLSRWLEVFRGHRLHISFFIGIVVALIAVFFIDIWKTPLIQGIVPPMFKVPVISISLFTVVTLAIVQLVVGGRASYRRLGIAIITTVTTFYRVITNPSKWKPLIAQLQNQIISGFHLFMNSSRIVETLRRVGRRAIHILPLAYFYILILGFTIAYLATKHPAFWVYSITINLSLTITFSLVMIGFLIEWAISSGLQFLIRKGVKKTFSILSVLGFVLLAFGFILQIVGVIKG